jgi:precorrin-6B methylase 2
MTIDEAPHFARRFAQLGSQLIVFPKPVGELRDQHLAMNFREKISLIVRSWAAVGVVETSRALALRALLPALTPKIDDDNYDKRNSTDTASPIPNAELEMSDAEAQKHATYYCTTPERFTRYIMSHLDINYQEYDFVDIGCGKGRVLLVASSFPFRSICGIDLSRTALKIAEKNIRTYRGPKQKCFNIHIRNGDARYFEPCIENTVYYFFHPFDVGTLDVVLTKIASKLRGQGKMIYIVCVWPDLASVLKLFETLGFRTIRTQKMLIPILNFAILSLQ